ncbi:MAG: DUF72 domain-containing protein, partial [Methylocella sp.]
SIHHAVEVRHESFNTPEFIALARAYGVAVVAAGDSSYPLIDEVTGPFVYARIMGTSEDEAAGYSKAGVKKWLSQIQQWRSEKEVRDVYFYVISGFKTRNPQAAMAIIAGLPRDS